MSLATGTKLGPYEILSALGAGGMGEVYKARDTRLDRTVAIKILPQALAADPQFRDRFDREARTISQLDHPHICALHDVGEQDGTAYLVMQYLEGETLADRLTKGALPLDQALHIAIQIADALATAHKAGIVHRDLKPGNVMLTKAGAKLLDFGLAKTGASVLGGANVSMLPTTPLITEQGAILGTFQYMAPEQLEGHKADSRSDIFTLGLIVYEMATGRRPLRGQSVAQSGLPDRLVHVISRCLALDPDDRWQSARDVKAEVEYAAAAKRQDTLITTPTPRGYIPWFVASIAAALGLVWGFVHLAQPVEIRVTHLEVAPPLGAEFRLDRGVAISPDGKLLTFVAGGAVGDTLWVRALDAPSARELAGTTGATFPFWSPDNKSIGFFGGGKLWRIEIAGGSPTPICDVPAGRGGTWNTDGTILFNAVNDGPLLRVAASGGVPALLTTVDTANKENSHRWPFFLADGRHFLYFVRGGPETDAVYEGSLDRPGDKTRIRFLATNAVYAAGENGALGQLLWVNSQGSLMAQRFDVGTGKLSGDPSVIAEGVVFGGASKLGTISVSNEGTLIYGAAPHDVRQLTWFGRDGRPQGTVGQPDSYLSLRISPDGKRVAVERPQEISQIDFSRGIPVRVASGSFTPVWAPDGEQVAYARGGPLNMFLQRISGMGQEVALHQTHDSEMPLDWSSDGRFLLFRLNPNDPSSKTQLDLFLLPMTGDRKPIPFLASSFREWWGRFSPNGKWVAYVSDESGRDEVYVQGFPANGMKSRVSTKGGTAMLWRRDGRELFYLSPDRSIISVPVEDSSAALEFGPPSRLFGVPLFADQDTSSYTYDVMPDGQRFLVISPARETGTQSLNVILHWQNRLQTR